MNKEELSKLREDYLRYVSCFYGMFCTDENFIFSGSDSHSYDDYNDYSAYSDK